MRAHRWSVPVGTVSGIELRVHISFVIVVALFAGVAPEPGAISAIGNELWLIVIFSCVVGPRAGSLLCRPRGRRKDPARVLSVRIGHQQTAIRRGADGVERREDLSDEDSTKRDESTRTIAPGDHANADRRAREFFRGAGTRQLARTLFEA
jgi:hypothetical protein